MSNHLQSNSAQSISNLSTAIGVVLLLLHFYDANLGMFLDMGLHSIFTDRLFLVIVKTGFFDSPNYSKWLALLALIIGMAAADKRKAPGGSWKRYTMMLGLGLMGYYLIDAGNMDGKDAFTNIVYDLLILLALGWILRYSSLLMRHIPLPWATNDPFGRQVRSFPQQQKPISNPWSLHLEGIYEDRGIPKKMWINLVNPRRGVLVLGAPGSGKSYFIIEPLIRQLMEKRMAMLIYDFKFDTLSKLAYTHFLAQRQYYPPGTKFYCINFSQVQKSHRCNVLVPESIQWLSDALGISRTILLSLNKSWVDQQGNFFPESAINLLGAVIWFLREYKEGIFCTLPHAIELATLDYKDFFDVLDTNPSIGAIIKPFLETFVRGTKEQLDGQVSGMRIALARLSSPDLYYILTGNDLDLHINKPQAPKILCLGGNANRMEAITPVLSLFIDRINRLCNQAGQYPCAMICDEFATVRATNMLTTLATGRSNDMIPILTVQDIAQLKTLYTQAEADTVLSVAANLLCGQVSGDVAKKVSERMPQIWRERASLSVNSGDTTVSRHPEWENVVTPATVAHLSSGEFVGVVSDDPEQETELKAFHARILRSAKDNVKGTELPVVHAGGGEDMMKAFEQVKGDIQRMVEEIKRGIVYAG
jgi:YWFCY protein/TraM recognition site of TraD and TraG